MAFVSFGNCVVGQNSLDEQTLLTIGDEKVKVDEFMYIYKKNNSQTSVQEPSSIEEYLNLYINFKLKVKEAEELKMDTASDFKKELDGYREQLAKPYFIDESVNEALLQEAYERKLIDIRASHILIMVDPNARPEDTLAAYEKIVQIREEVMSGKDFADAAVEYSEDQSARDREEIPGKQRFKAGNKGDLGYFTVFNMVYPFENAAYETPVGEISQPYRTKYGYHLVKVNDKKEALGTAVVAHIYVGLRPDAPEEDVADAQEKIDNIYQKIQEGMSFEDAVIQYSDDKGSARNGGKLSKFTCNRIVPEFVIVADQLEPNGISEPVKTMYGFHIVKLISRDRPGTFEEEETGLKERLQKDNRTHKSEESVIQRIKLENGFSVNEKAKSAVFAKIDTAVLNMAFVADSLAGMNKTILKIGKEKHSQTDFALFIEANQKRNPNIDKDVYLEQLFQQFGNTVCFDYENARLEEKYPEFRILMKEYHDGILLFNLTDEKVWSKAVKDTTGLENYFASNNETYQWGERVDATIFEIRKKEDAEQVKVFIDMFPGDGDIAAAIEKDSINSVKIIPGKFERNDNKYIDEVEWTAGNIVELSSDVEDLVVIVKIKEVMQPAPKELNEARGIATADYQEYLEVEWIEQLKTKYPVVINNEVLQQLTTVN